MTTEDQPAKNEARQCSVAVGHTILETGEGSVALIVNGQGALCSVAGARILAAQILQWADHAEKLNANLPQERVAKFFYRVMNNIWQEKKEGVVVSNADAAPAAGHVAAQTVPQPEKMTAMFKAEMKSARKVKKAKRK